MFARSQSPSQRQKTYFKVHTSDSLRLRNLSRGASDKSSLSPLAKPLSNKSLKKPLMTTDRSRIERTIDVLSKKLTSSRSFQLSGHSKNIHIQMQSTTNSKPIHTLQIPQHSPTNMKIYTPTHIMGSMFPARQLYQSKLTPINGSNNKFFTKKTQRQPDINDRLNHIKQGIDKCLKQLELRKFQIIKKLGSGVNGQVALARLRNLNFIVALKAIKKSEIKSNSKCFIEEIKIQSFISHPNIIQLYGLTSDQQNIYMVLEVSSHNLFRQIRQEKGFSEAKTKNYVKQVLQALSFLHDNNIIHRDVKPQNILNCHGILKLCDFGWATYNGGTEMRKTFCGTYDYVSPEVSQGFLYNEQVDAWAVGVLTFEMLTAAVPFKQKLLVQEQVISFPPKVSRGAKDFILKLLNFNPKRRMDVRQAKQHPWLKDTEVEQSRMIQQDIEMVYSNQ